MYALNDVGQTAGAPPPPQPATPTEQLEPRAVEASERTSLTTEEERNTGCNSTQAVLELVETSAESYAEMLEGLEEREAGMEAGATAEPGQALDVYA